LRSILCACLCSLAACHGPTTSAYDEPCAALATARCTQLSMCTGGSATAAGFSVSRQYGDLETCITRSTLGCLIGVGVVGSEHSAADVAACASAWSQITCADLLNQVTPAACTNHGTLVSGEPCVFASQCETATCLDMRDSPCGSCGAPPAVGASCETNDCASGQECVLTTMLCQAVVPYEGSCDSDHPCGVDATRGTLACAGSKCVPAGAVNAPCGGQPSGPAKPGCDFEHGLYCPPGGGTCAISPLVGNGEPCGHLTATIVACMAGTCYTSAGVAVGVQQGTCKAAVMEGAACDSVLGPPCLTPARCVSSGAGTAGRCALPTLHGCSS
jgi:hypothetical protein